MGFEQAFGEKIKSSDGEAADEMMNLPPSQLNMINAGVVTPQEGLPTQDVLFEKPPEMRFSETDGIINVVKKKANGKRNCHNYVIGKKYKYRYISTVDMQTKNTRLGKNGKPIYENEKQGLALDFLVEITPLAPMSIDNGWEQYYRMELVNAIVRERPLARGKHQPGDKE